MAARKKTQVRIRARVSFNSVHQGDVASVEMNEVVQGWLDAGLVEVVPDGKDPVGPGGTEQDTTGRKPGGAGGGGPAGGEPGQGFGSGGYGAP